MKVSDSGIIAAGDLRPHDADAPCQIERYIASRRHIHRIAIATQEAAFATRLRLQISNGFVADRDLGRSLRAFATTWHAIDTASFGTSRGSFPYSA